MTTGVVLEAPVILIPLMVTLAIPASAPTVIVPVTTADVPSCTLLSAAVRLPSTFSITTVGGVSVRPSIVIVSVVLLVSLSPSLKV